MERKLGNTEYQAECKVLRGVNTDDRKGYRVRFKHAGKVGEKSQSKTHLKRKSVGSLCNVKVDHLWRILPFVGIKLQG